MGHLVDAIKKLEQRRVIEEATPAQPARAKSTRKRSRRIDPPHPATAAPRATRRQAGQPAGEVEPASAIAPPPAAPPSDAEPREIAIEPIARAAAPAKPSLAEQPPIVTAGGSEAGAECLPVEKLAELADPAPEPIPATIALAALDAAPAVPISAASPRPGEPLCPLRLLVEEEVATATDAATTIWEIPTPDVPSDYRQLAAKLCCPSLESGPVRRVLVAGTTAAAIEAISLPALAVALSARGSVLWVAPRRRWPVAAPAGAEDFETPGLRELVSGEASWDEAIRKTSLAEVSFVGCGVGPPDDRGEASLAAGLESLPEGFSLILVDGGLAEESAALAAFCQSVGLAVAIGHDRRREIENALAALAYAGVHAPLVIAVG